jgi:hypothetical protein
MKVNVTSLFCNLLQSAVKVPALEALEVSETLALFNIIPKFCAVRTLKRAVI